MKKHSTLKTLGLVLLGLLSVAAVSAGAFLLINHFTGSFDLGILNGAKDSASEVIENVTSIIESAAK